MSRTAKIDKSRGNSFCGLLTILFIGLKLCGVIDWSWWWVLSPVWIPTAVAIVVLTLLLLIELSERKNKVL